MTLERAARSIIALDDGRTDGPVRDHAQLVLMAAIAADFTRESTRAANERGAQNSGRFVFPSSGVMRDMSRHHVCRSSQ
jgi:hypothetical protein